MELHAAPIAAARPLALDAPTLVHAFQYTAAQRPDEIALRNPGDAVSLTWREYAERVERIAAGLAALGVERGDAVGLMLLNRPEFHLVDTAVLHLGATPFSVYNTSTPEQVAHQFANAGNRVVVTERHFLPAVLEARAVGPRSTRSCSSTAPRTAPCSLDQLEELGASSFRFTETWQAVRPSDLATIIYTSGTTGPPKGVELTHANAMAQCAASAERCPLTPGRARDVLPAERARRRPLDVPLVGVDHARLHGHLDRRHADGDPDAPRPAADHVGRRAADLGEAPAHAHEPGHRRPGGAERGGAGRAAGAARVRPRRAPRRRRGADADRRAALLRRARPADRRGLGDVRDRRRGHGQPARRHPPRHLRDRAAGRRAQARRTTPSCSCAGRS